MKINRDELRWAAGFWDGEGHAHSDERHKQRGRGIAMQIVQVDKRPLKRFHAAICGLGKFYGPYTPKTKRSQPYFVWTNSSFEHGQQVAVMLWPFLCEGKREQLKNALSFCWRPKKRPGPKRQKFCKRGHLLAKTRYIRPNGMAGTCRACARMREEALSA